MKKISTSLIGLSLLTFSSAIYALDYNYECVDDEYQANNGDESFSCTIRDTDQGSNAVYNKKNYDMWLKMKSTLNMTGKTKFICTEKPNYATYVCKPQTKDIQSIIPYAKKNEGGWYMNSGVPMIQLSQELSQE